MYTNNKKSQDYLIDFIKKIPVTAWEVLIKIDDNLSDEHLKTGSCRKCGSKHLTYHRYSRKPRFGLFEKYIPIKIQEKFYYRHSSKCLDCNAQNTPQSVKFLGRKVYIGLFVLMTMFFLEKLPVDVKNIQDLLSNEIPLQTALRWFHWFFDTVIKSTVWKIVQGLIGIVQTLTALEKQFAPQFKTNVCLFPSMLRGISLITIPQHYRAIGDLPLSILRHFFYSKKIKTKMDVLIL